VLARIIEFWPGNGLALNCRASSASSISSRRGAVGATGRALEWEWNDGDLGTVSGRCFTLVLMPTLEREP